VTHNGKHAPRVEILLRVDCKLWNEAWKAWEYVLLDETHWVYIKIGHLVWKSLASQKHSKARWAEKANKKKGAFGMQLRRACKRPEEGPVDPLGCVSNCEEF
jgi:hypothetical protein